MLFLTRILWNMDRARVKEGDGRDGGQDGISRVLSMMRIEMRLTVVVEINMKVQGRRTWMLRGLNAYVPATFSSFL